VSATGQDDRIRRLLEELEAVPGDARAFAELAGLYESSGRFEELVALHERGARLAPVPAS
jgi:hypothetical protein